MRFPCWDCGCLLLVRHALCGLCGAAYHHGAAIRLTDLAQLEEEARGHLGAIARMANSALKHGERELSLAANATEASLSELLKAIAEMRKAVKRDVQAELRAVPALRSVP